MLLYMKQAYETQMKEEMKLSDDSVSANRSESRSGNPPSWSFSLVKGGKISAR